MKIGPEDLFSIVTYAAAGSLIAGVYKLSTIFVERTCGTKLETYSEAIQHDSSILPLMGLLEKKFKQFDEVYFCRLVECLDRLIWIRLSLQNKNSIIGSISEKEVYMYFQLIRKNVKQLRISIDNSGSVQNLVEFDEIIKKICTHVETHMVQILKSTH